MYTVRGTFTVRDDRTLSEALSVLNEWPASVPSMVPARVYSTCALSPRFHGLTLEWDYEEAQDILAAMDEFVASEEAMAYQAKWNEVCEHNSFRREIYERNK